MSEYWPFADLRISAGDVVLRLPTLEDMYAIADVASRGIHTADEMPFTVPWSVLPTAERGRSIMQWIWRRLGEITVEAWCLPFAVVYQGQMVGVQHLRGKQFTITRHVETGSWIGREFHGQGIGTRMRVAVLEFAFTGLGALTAASGAFQESHASIAISRKLGYKDNGVSVDAVDGKRRVSQDFLLHHNEWKAPFSVEIEGTAACKPLLGAQ